MTSSAISYREITLTQGQVAKVSAHRYEQLAQWKWFARWNKTNASFYAARNLTRKEGSPQTIYMHRFILGLAKGDCREGDHINHNTLDNTDDNLRIASVTEQARNHRCWRKKTSKYRGVYAMPNGRWRAVIADRHLGYFPTEETASEAYTAAASTMHGEYACIE